MKQLITIRTNVFYKRIPSFNLAMGVVSSTLTYNGISNSGKQSWVWRNTEEEDNFLDIVFALNGFEYLEWPDVVTRNLTYDHLVRFDLTTRLYGIEPIVMKNHFVGYTNMPKIDLVSVSPKLVIGFENLCDKYLDRIQPRLELIG